MALNGSSINKVVLNGADSNTFKQVLSSLSSSASTIVKSVGRGISLLATGTPNISRILRLLRTLSINSTGSISIAKAISITKTILSSITTTLIRLPNKILIATLTSAVYIQRLIGKVFSTISEHVAVLIVELASHFLTITASVTGSTSIKRGIAKTISLAVTNISILVNRVGKLLTSLTTSAVTLSNTINKIITKAVTSTISIVVHFFFYRFLTIASTIVPNMYKGLSMNLSTLTTSVATIVKAMNKLIALNVIVLFSLVAEFVKKFGAIAKYTFIVQPKERLISIAKNTTSVVRSAQRSLSIIKSRIILLFRNPNG